jgi:chromosome segregation ATPase
MALTEKVTPIRKRSFPSSDREVKTLQTAVHSLRWTLHVPLVGDALGFGYRVVSEMANPDHPISEGSVAALTGLSTVGELISSKISEGGLDLDWNEWKSSVSAFIYRKQFSIHHSKKEDILAEYQDVVSFLGRGPNDALEFQRAKTKILGQERKSESDILRGESASLRLRNQELEKTKVVLDEEVTALKSNIETLTADLDSAKGFSSRIESERDIDLAKAAFDAESRVGASMKAHFDSEMAELVHVIKGLKENLEKAQNEADRSNELAESRSTDLASVNNRYKALVIEHDTLVSQYSELKTASERGDDQVLSLSAKISDLKIQLEEKSNLLINAKNHTHSETQEALLEDIKMLNSEISGLSSSLSKTKRSLLKLEAMSVRMKDYIAFLKSEREKQDQQLSEREGQLRQAMRKVTDLRKKLTTTSPEVGSLRKQRGLAITIAVFALIIASYLIFV